MNGVLLKPLPYTDADRIVSLRTSFLATGATQGLVSIANYRDWRDQSTSFEAMAASGGAAETAVAKFTSGGKPIASIAYFPQVLPGNALLVETEAPNGDNQLSVLDLATF